MSVPEVLLPSPPPENGPQDHMSGLFSRPAQHNIPSDAISEPNGVESDSAARKRVEFHPWTTNISEAQLSTPNSEVAPSLKSLPPSRTCQQTKRPILKATPSLENVPGFDGHNEKKPTFEDMNSLLEQLANNDRLSSLDAYQTMLNLIKMYERPPEETKLKEKMASLQKYIKRDLLVLDKDTESLLSEVRLSMQNLVTSALKILVTIVWIPSYASCLTDDFRLWTVERAIQVLKGRTASKPVILHYMHFLAMQNYQDAIVSSGKRALQLLEALQELPDHISGKAVIAERLLVYQRLLDQARPTMRMRAELWVRNLMTAMSHNFKEVRSNAISLGTRASTVFGGAASIADEARKVLAETKGERTLSASTTNRLESILAAKDEANQIPQIWTIVLMLCNSNQHRLETWGQFEHWVRLIQRCFNCSDVSIKTQAYMAWNRLYYVARPHQASDQLLPLLAKPAVLHLEKTGNNPSKGTRQAVMSSYTMLLYYAFRPAATHQQTTRMWNEFIVKIMTRKFLSSSTSNCDLCCRVLSTLFHSSLGGTRVWNEHRGLENAPLDPLELPAIDCKWIRLQISAVLAIIELLSQYSSFGPDGELSEQAYVAQAWRNLMKAIRESSSKEVVTSPETKAALNCVAEFLKPRQPENTLVEDPSAFNVRLALLSRITVAELVPSLGKNILESLTGTGNIMIVKELTLTLFKPKTSSSSMENRAEELLDRCLSCWSRELDVSDPATVLQASNEILTQIAPEKVIQALTKIQRRAAVLIEDQSQYFSLDDKSSRYDMAYYTFCVSVVNSVAHVSLVSYDALDDLIASILTTRHTLLRVRLIQSWGERTWNNEQYSYGPKLLKVLTESRNKLDVNLPGFTSQSTEGRAPSSTTHPASSKKQLDSGSINTSVQTKGAPKRNKAQSSREKRHHDDSQIQFMPIESSPLNEVFESQLLTVHQKEVRERQQTEPAITFADLRSTPPTEKKNKKRRAQSAETENELKHSPELPATPTLPQSKAQDDQDEQPTPTPKTRKSLRQQLQPDITSSPPSVSGDNERLAACNAITSSPVKDVHEGEDTIQLGEVRVSEPRKQLFEVQVLVPKLPWAVSAVARDERGGRLASPEIELPDVADIISGANQDNLENAEPRVSTPASYSDEYDALAASQLFQNLEEQSFTGVWEVRETPTSQTKRKRTHDDQAEGGKKKKRKNPETSTKTVESQVQTEDNEDSDNCIVVNIEESTPVSRASRAGSSQQAATKLERRKPGRPRQSQELCGHATNTTPSSQESSGKRKKSRSSSKRKSRSRNSSQRTSPSSSRSASSSRGAEKAIEDVQMGEERDQSELPSLGSEVMETVQSEKAAPLEHPQPVSDTSAGARLQQEVTADEVSGVHGITHSLQDILNGISDANSAVKPSKHELAAIHSLCFKIGLKAQELAGSQA